MKVLQYRNGLFHTVKLPRVSGTRGEEVQRNLESRLAKFADRNDDINNLTIDFCGSYIPIEHKSELRLVAAMLRAYQEEKTPSEIADDQV